MPIDPAEALSEAGLRRGAGAWRAFERTLRPGLRGQLPPGAGVNPWARTRNQQANSRLAVHYLGETLRRQAAADMAAVVRGEMELAEWQERQAAMAQAMVAASAQVGMGGGELTDAATHERLALLLLALDVKLTALSDKAAQEEITLPQAGAWWGQAGRGAIRTAQQVGGAQWFGSKPVRRIMGAGERHCFTCPGKVRPYASLEACLEACGGWPGDGSDQCHGNCYCSIEPADAYSVIPGAEGVGDPSWQFTPITQQEANWDAPIPGPRLTPEERAAQEARRDAERVERERLRAEAKRLRLERAEAASYESHLARVPVPREVQALEAASAAGHVGFGKWSPLEVRADAIPDALREHLDGLGYHGAKQAEMVQLMGRFTSGSWHLDKAELRRVADYVDASNDAGVGYRGRLIRAIKLPTKRGAVNFDKMRNGSLEVGGVIREDRVTSWTSRRARAGNVYLVMEDAKGTAASVRSMAANRWFWQDEAVLAADVPLTVKRVQRVELPQAIHGSTEGWIIHVEPYSAP